MSLALTLLLLVADPPEPKKFVQGFLETRFTKKADLAPYFGKEITLLSGHEYLKKGFGLTDKDNREMLTVETKRYLEVNSGLIDSIPEKKLTQLRDGIAGYGYEVKELKAGENVLDAKERQRFAAEEGDKAVFVRPKPGGDYLLYILRQSGTTWRIVAEYLD